MVRDPDIVGNGPATGERSTVDAVNVLLLVAVPVVLLGLLVASFVITRQAVAGAAARLERELPGHETVVARASANCVAGAQRGMGALVVTDEALRFRGARARETLEVPRAAIRSAAAAATGRPTLTVEWPAGSASWRVADPAPLAAALAPRK